MRETPDSRVKLQTLMELPEKRLQAWTANEYESAGLHHCQEFIYVESFWVWSQDFRHDPGSTVDAMC